MKILFMGSPEISIPFLDFLFSKNVELVVFSQKDKIRGRGKKLEPTPVKKRAEELKIPVFTLSAKSEEAFKIISDFNPDILFVVAFGQILPKRILDSAKLYPLNIHFSLLPEYRGATPVNTSILNGNTETGTSVMIMDEGMDTGDTIYSEKCEILPEDNASSLFKKLIKKSIDILNKNWEQICSGSVNAIPQTGTPSKTKLIRKEDLILDFKKDSKSVYNQIRAFNTIPGVRTVFRGNIISIENALFLDNCNGNPGEITEVGKDFFTVCCKNGGIKILQVKPSGKNSMKVSEFINGYKPVAGEILG